MFFGQESLRCSTKNLEKKLLAASANKAVRSSLREESQKQMDAKLIELKELQPQLERKDGELTVLYKQQAKNTAKLAQLRPQSRNKTSKTTE